MVIRCTSKLLKEMDLRKPDLREMPEKQQDFLGEWYAHLFYFERRKCVIFTNAKTLFSFVAFGAKRKDIKKLDVVFRKELGRALYEEDFSSQDISWILKACENITYGKTISRSVIGSMNDLITQYHYFVGRSMFFDNKDSDGWRMINRTPMGTLKYGLPIERFVALLKTAQGK